MAKLKRASVFGSILFFCDVSLVAAWFICAVLQPACSPYGRQGHGRSLQLSGYARLCCLSSVPSLLHFRHHAELFGRGLLKPSLNIISFFKLLILLLLLGGRSNLLLCNWGLIKEKKSFAVFFFQENNKKCQTLSLWPYFIVYSLIVSMLNTPRITPIPPEKMKPEILISFANYINPQNHA